MKKIWSCGLLSEKTEVCMQNLMKKWKQLPAVTLQQSIFYNIYSTLVAKNHKNIWSRCLIHEFSSTDIFLVILIMVTEQVYWKKVFCGCLRPIWLWLFIAIMKRCAERCELQLYRTSSSHISGMPEKVFKFFWNWKTSSNINVIHNKEKSIGRTQKTFFESTIFQVGKF